MAPDDRQGSKIFSFSLPPEDGDAIEEVAQARGWHKSRVVREAIRLYCRFWRDWLDTAESGRTDRERP